MKPNHQHHIGCTRVHPFNCHTLPSILFETVIRLNVTSVSDIPLWGNTWNPIINIISGTPRSVLARLLPGQAISKYKGREVKSWGKMPACTMYYLIYKWVKWEDYSLRHVPQLLSRSCCCCRSCWCRWEQAQIRDIEYQSTNSFEEINWIQREWECCLFKKDDQV